MYPILSLSSSFISILIFHHHGIRLSALHASRYPIIMPFKVLIGDVLAQMQQAIWITPLNAENANVIKFADKKWEEMNKMIEETKAI